MKKLSKTAGKVAEQITEIIVELLESKNLTPWNCTWVGGGRSSNHKNYASSLTSFYDSWLNQMLLECAMRKHDFTSTEWITASELKKRKISFKGIPTTGKIVGWRDAYYKTHEPSGDTEWASSKQVSQCSYHPAQELIQQGYIHVKLPKLYSLWNIDQFEELESRLPTKETVEGTLNDDDVIKDLVLACTIRGMEANDFVEDFAVEDFLEDNAVEELFLKVRINMRSFTTLIIPTHLTWVFLKLWMT